jgi:small subunit ribosomal protein MRP21
MGSRAFGELLLRPRTFTRLTPALAPSWRARFISNTPPTSGASPTQSPETATTPEVAAQSPGQTPQNEANAAIDSLFSASSSDAATPPAPIDRLFGNKFSPRGPRRSRPPTLAFDDMLGSQSIQNPSLSNKPSTDLEQQQKATFESYPRLNPEYGRTVKLDVARGRDIVRGIGMLGSLMARNRVKSDFNKQRFHERGGLKRKRLNSERWRARFKVGFQRVTGRVMELTRKGW